MCPALTSSEPSAAIARPFGEKPSGRPSAEKGKRSRGQRVLNALSGARAGGRVQAVSKTFRRLLFENGLRLKTALSYDIRPPPLTALSTASRHSKPSKFDQRHLKTQLFSCCAASLRPLNPYPVRLLCFRYVRQACLYFSCLKLSETHVSTREISTQNSVTHIAMDLTPPITWKASPTRTPPPICTSAPNLNPRWSQEPWAQRTFLEIHHGLFPATKMIHRSCHQKRLDGRPPRQRLSCRAARF